MTNNVASAKDRNSDMKVVYNLSREALYSRSDSECVASLCNGYIDNSIAALTSYSTINNDYGRNSWCRPKAHTSAF